MCKTNCHFAIMVKKDFKQTLEKIENKVRHKFVDFLSGLPFLSTWNEANLGKLMFAVIRKQVNLNEFVIREG